MRVSRVGPSGTEAGSSLNLVIGLASDMIYASREILEKFIRELHSVANCVKALTITFGSILLMKIRKVKIDSDDVTLAIPSAILPGQLAAHSLIYAGTRCA